MWWTAGVHPHDARSFDSSRDLAAIREHVALGAVAVGECGLDYHYDHSPREQQRLAFAEQLALAAELRRPVIVHTREAEEDTRAMVSDAGRRGVRGVMHCFTGSHALGAAALDAGWFISFAGSSRSSAGRTTRSCVSCPMIGCWSSRTRRISRPFRTAESATSPRICRSRSPASPPRAARRLQRIATSTAANARELFGLAVSDQTRDNDVPDT